MPRPTRIRSGTASKMIRRFPIVMALLLPQLKCGCSERDRVALATVSGMNECRQDSSSLRPGKGLFTTGPIREAGERAGTAVTRPTQEAVCLQVVAWARNHRNRLPAL